MFSVTADHLVGIVVGIMQRYFLYGMRQTDRVSLSFAAGKSVCPFRRKFPVIAKTQHGRSSLISFSSL
jgi:hypothetical protein